MSRGAPSDPGPCPGCGAADSLWAGRCWRCGHRGPSRPTVEGESPGIAGPPPEADPDLVVIANDGGPSAADDGATEPSRWPLATAIVVTVALGLILAGTYREAPGLALLLVIVLVPVLLVAHNRAWVRYRPGPPRTRAEQVATFWSTLAMGLFMIVAIPIVMILAGFVAFYAICNGGCGR